MTKQEFQDWIKLTKQSQFNWILDQIQLQNNGRYLFYKGGADGVYLEVQPDGVATIGNYEGALPHIGEALFKPVHSRKVADDADEALGKILEKMGLGFLLNLVGVRQSCNVIWG